MPTDEIVPAHGYSPWWLWIGIVLAVLVVLGWLLLVRAYRRARRSEAAEPGPAATPAPALDGDTQDPWAHARAEALAAIDEAEARHRDGELDDRGVHRALSAAVRAFATQRTGAPATTLTLHELQRDPGLRPAAQVVALVYEPEFAVTAQAGSVTLPQALAEARRVVASW